MNTDKIKEELKSHEELNSNFNSGVDIALYLLERYTKEEIQKALAEKDQETTNDSSIPPKCIKRRNEDDGGNIADALRELEVGDSAVFPRSRENGLRASAGSIGIKITSRRLGRTDKVTVWRIA